MRLRPDPRLREFLDPRAFREPSYRKKLFSRTLIVSSRTIPTRLKAAIFKDDRLFCPVCEHHVSRFLSWGSVPEVWCPVCTAFDRHRLSWLFFSRSTDLFDGRPKRMLHFAPEPAFERRLKAVPELDYITADLINPNAMVRIDVTDIDQPDDTFDIIYCSHVLEHVAAPQRAMRELHRVLRPGGWAALEVPIADGPTLGDPTNSDPRERERLFGQHDHFWRFGPDFADLLRDAGFAVEVVRATDIASEEECRLMALPADAPLFHCRKSRDC